MLTHPLRSLSAVLLLLTLAACATDLDPARQYSGHYLLVHADGYPLDSEFHGVQNGDLKTKVEEPILAGLRRHIDAGGACGGTLRLLIFVHGGLNPHAKSFERMKDLLQTDPAQPLKETCYYPLFINWDSDLGSSIADDLVGLRFGRRAPIVGWLTSPVVFSARLVGSMAHLPVALMHNGDHVMESINGAREQEDPTHCILGDSLINAPRNAASLATIPFLEGFGTPAWEIMKRRAELAVASRLADGPDQGDAFVNPRNWHRVTPQFAQQEGSQPPFAANAAPNSLATLAPPANQGAVRTLARLLRSNMAAVEGTTPPVWKWTAPTKERRDLTVEITIVGHSMGAFLVNHLLAVMDLDDQGRPRPRPMPVREIVYLAPAAPLNELEDFMIPYLQSNRQATFSIFVLNRRDETREMGWASGVLLLPRGSVLAWIDTYFQPGNTIGQGTAGRMRNLKDYYAIKKVRRDSTTSNCLDPIWKSGNGPPPEDLPLRKQFLRLEIDEPQATAALHRTGRFRLYESPARLNDDAVPREHGDFTRPDYLYEVLCHVGQGQAFKDPAYCDQPPPWMKAPPRGANGQETP